MLHSQGLSKRYDSLQLEHFSKWIRPQMRFTKLRENNLVSI